MLDEDAVARTRQHAQQQRERMLRTRRDEDLLRCGGGAATGEVLGDRGAEHRQPERVIARARQVPRELGHGRRERAVQGPRGRRGGRAGEVDLAGMSGRAGRYRCGAPVGRQAGPAAGAPATGEKPFVAQPCVCRGRGRPADAERRGELALPGQARAQRQAAVEHEQPQRARQGRVPGP
jgi:hypothetical protein